MSDSSLDAPRPPGGPQRDDAPAGPDSPGQAAPDPGPGTSRVTRPDDDGTEAHPGESADRPEQDEARRALQQENAETSLDQPSQ